MQRSCTALLHVLFVSLSGGAFTVQRSCTALLHELFVLLSGGAFAVQRSCTALLHVLIALLPILFLSGCAAEADSPSESFEEASVTIEEDAMKDTDTMVPFEAVEAGDSAVSDTDTGITEPMFLEAEPSGSEEETEEAAEEETEETAADTTAEEDEETESEDTAVVFTQEPIPDEVFSRMLGVSYPQDCPISRDDLRYLRLSYHDFNGNTQTGELVCNKKIASDLVEIFEELYKRGYQIDKMRLIDEYGGDDDLSCADDNTSCFNFRTVSGSQNLSKHAYGVAIDINPFYNPYVTYPGGKERISPPGSEPYADRSSDFPHKIGPGDDVYELFKAHGFTWGGNWKTLKDYQHFQKTD